MPELSDDQWQALITVFVAAWELVDDTDDGSNRHIEPKTRVKPLREALVAFEVAGGGEDSHERVAVAVP